MSDAIDVCCLCGKPATDEDPITREHVPPKQFYPKRLRDGLNLWVVATHRSCNNQHKADEEYFFHALYPLVANVNPRTANVILDDLKRRAKNHQTPTLLRRILRTARTTTEGGLLLPPGDVRMNADKRRLQRVAMKIGRCLFYRDHKRVMPHENCKDIRLCEHEEDVPELYTLSWEMSKVNVNDLVPSEPSGLVVVADVEAGQALAVCRQVFDYRPAYFEEKRLHLYTLRFWEAFVFCMAFEDPDALPH
ncbi:MAG: HNH endonuclease [Gemmataceae bacterium]|nr:HNH endonuclease [Gemmataceae bacterium]